MPFQLVIAKFRLMTCFEISVNGEKSVLAGIDNKYGVLTAHVTWTRRAPQEVGDVAFHVMGLESKTGVQPKWFSMMLDENDEVVIKIKEAEAADPPISTRTVEELKEMELESKIRQYHRLKEELKEHLGES